MTTEDCQERRVTTNNERNNNNDDESNHHNKQCNREIKENEQVVQACKTKEQPRSQHEDTSWVYDEQEANKLPFMLLGQQDRGCWFTNNTERVLFWH